MAGEVRSAWTQLEQEEGSGWTQLEQEENSGWLQLEQGVSISREAEAEKGAGSSAAWAAAQPGDYVDLGYFDEEMEILGRTVQVRVAYTAKGVEDWIEGCVGQDLVYGIDIEWQPNQFKGDDNKAALLQLAGKRGCLIIQLLYMDYLPKALSALLADPKAKLAGVGVYADTRKLLADYGLECNGQVDLGPHAARVLQRTDLKRAGLSTLCNAILHILVEKNKRITRSNWAAQGLSAVQIKYAATDACIAYFVLEALNKMAG